MISRRSKRFKKLYELLPAETRALAVKNYRLWKDNRDHPSLNFEEVMPGRWSVRVGLHYRALGSMQADGAMVWTWIGSHETYDKLLQQR